MKYSQPLWSYKQLIMKAETHMLSHLCGIPLTVKVKMNSLINEPQTLIENWRKSFFKE